MDEKNTHTLSMPASLDAQSLDSLKRRILDALNASHSCVKVDAGSVERIPTAGIQFLLAAQKTAAASGGVVEWLRPSAALQKAIEDLGLGEHFKTSLAKE